MLGVFYLIIFNVETLTERLGLNNNQILAL